MITDIITDTITGIMVYRWVEFKIVEQRFQIVLQLRKGSTITPEWSKVVSRYDWWLPMPIVTIGTWLEDRIGSLWGEREPSVPTLFSFIKHMRTSEHWYEPIQWHTKRIIRNTMEIISISIVVGILRIHGTTGGWTIWALSGDQRLHHVFKAHRGSIDVSYPHVGMECIWLSESPNWVWQVRDSLSELIRTTGGSHGGRTVWAGDRDCLGTNPRILASTCNAFECWLCNPRVSGTGGSEPGRPSGIPGNVPGSRLGGRRVLKEAAVFQIFHYLKPMPLTVNWPVRRLFGRSS